jgi:galactokinase
VTPIVEKAISTFREEFSGEPDLIIQAPGRVNLIGEHTDYNAGFVFPAAIDRWLVLAARKREDDLAVIHSAAHGEKVSFNVNETPERHGNWGDYPQGVVREFQKLGHTLSGFDAVLAGDVPVGAGLSSSAAVEMAVGKSLLEMNDIEMSGPDLALLGQRAENQFVGVNCGIMDQFVSGNASEGHALFLDCRDLSYEHVPLASEGVRIVICNSRVTRGRTDSAYNDRRGSCEEGVAQLSKASGQHFDALRDVSMETLEENSLALSPNVYRRCRHVVSEIERTRKAVELLKSDNLVGFGQLMAQSHNSLRIDYEVSGEELDLLVQIARGVSGVLGARMTGAGFGGCTVNLVEEDALDAFEATVGREYNLKTGLDPEIYVCKAVAGAGIAI